MPCSLHSFFSNSFGLLRDHIVRGCQDADRRAVVLFELDHMQAREIDLQLLEVFERRAAPAIDRLVIVADRRKRGAPARPAA